MRYAVVFLMGVVGCSTSEPTGVIVRGKVEYCGQPLAGGMVVFTPDTDRGESGPLGHAVIGADGTYTLKAADASGMKPGWHRVSVAPPPGVGDRFPARLRNPQSSGLTREVRKEENVIDFTLDGI